MTKLILAISPDLDLLEQINAHLQEGGRFQVLGVSSGKEALASAAKQTFDLAILDAEANDLPFLPLTRELVALLPNLKLLIYPPNNNIHHPLLNGVLANGYLNKPFFGPEVNEKISRTLNEPDLADFSTSGNNLPRMWVEHPESGMHQIEQLLASTTASAGMLLMHGQILATSGALSDEASHNVVNFLTRYWINIQSGELFRYLKMDNESSNYLVYATPLFKDVAFGLVYHSNISLANIRAEVATIRDTFLSHYGNTGELRSEFLPPYKNTREAESAFTAARFPEPAPLPDDGLLPQEIIDNETKASPSPVEFSEQSSTVVVPPIEEQAVSPELAADYEPSSQPEEIKEDQGNQQFNDGELTDLAALLASIPENEPETDKAQQGLNPAEIAQIDSLLAEMPVPDPEEPNISEPVPTLEDAGDWFLNSSNSPAETQENSSSGGQPPSLPEQPLQTSETEAPSAQTTPTAPVEFPDFNFTLPWNEESESKSVNLTPPPLPVSLSEQEAASPSPQNFSNPSALLFQYQILLLPNNPEQFLTHELASLLNRQLPRLHEFNGWQCTGISIRPLYLQWTAILPAAISMHEMVQEIKQSTEIQIFAAFPSLLKTNPEAIFWAPGYFSISGSRSFSNRLVNDYISLSRQTLSGQIPG